MQAPLPGLVSVIIYTTVEVYFCPIFCTFSHLLLFTLCGNM
nr:MAG TPA: hypothetical protein [Caudoviricetes sp.]